VTAEGEGLSDHERTCLLRAARIELMRLKDEFYRLQDMQASKSVLESAGADVQCLSLAIEWLWHEGINSHEKGLRPS
jgi:hypothetical protein